MPSNSAKIVQQALERKQPVTITLEPDDFVSALKSALSVVKHGLHVTERYWQFKVAEMLERGLDVKYTCSIETVDKGVKMVIKADVDDSSIVELAKFHAMLRTHKKNMKRYKRKFLTNHDFKFKVEEGLPDAEEILEEEYKKRRGIGHGKS
jgi:hypothetical protein